MERDGALSDGNEVGFDNRTGDLQTRVAVDELRLVAGDCHLRDVRLLDAGRSALHRQTQAEIQQKQTVTVRHVDSVTREYFWFISYTYFFGSFWYFS